MQRNKLEIDRHWKGKKLEQNSCLEGGVKETKIFSMIVLISLDTFRPSRNEAMMGARYQLYSWTILLITILLKSI